MPSSADSRIACVTGAAGFIGSHLVRELLAHDIVVRAAVRDADDAPRVAHLRDIAAQLGASDRLSLHSAPLDDASAIDAAVAGSDWVLHLATAMTGASMTSTAVTGTDHVLKAIARHPSVRGLAVTSSITAVLSDRPRPGHVYTEDDWYDGGRHHDASYAASKAAAERRVWQFAADRGAELVTLVVNPTLVVGAPLAPAHLGGSLGVLHDLVDGRYLGAPPYGYGIVHVADVVRVLRLGMQRQIGGRFILDGGGRWLRDIVAAMQRELPERRLADGRLLATLRFIAATARRHGLAAVPKQLGRLDRVSAAKAAETFQIEWRTPESALHDFCAWLRARTLSQNVADKASSSAGAEFTLGQ